MWLKIDDGLIEHPKMYRAGAHLGGRSGRQRAFCVFMAGLSWSSRQLADGLIPDDVVRTFVIDQRPIDVANVLAFADVRLWHHEGTAYRIHDYFHHNPTAETVKKKRDEDRLRKKVGKGFRPDSDGNPRGFHADSGGSRARGPYPLAFSSSEDPTGPTEADAPKPVLGIDKPDTFAAIVWAEVRAAVQQGGPAALADPKDIYLRICSIADHSTPPIAYLRSQLDDEFSRACLHVEREWQQRAGARR